jgi:hypothetical protein
LIRRALAGAGVCAAAAVAFAFLLFPIVAIFSRVSPGRLVAQLSRPAVPWLTALPTTTQSPRRFSSFRV